MISLREAIANIKSVFEADKKNTWLTAEYEESMRTVLEAARERADEIDDEDPEGMQDRICSTCEHDDKDTDEAPCDTCNHLWHPIGNRDTDNWEPKEDA